MAKRSSKHAQVVPIALTLSGGLNLEKSLSDIGDNELGSAINYIYDRETDLLTTRPGTTCVTGAALSSIRKLHSFIKDATGKFLVGAAGSTIYSLSGTGWNTVGALFDAATVPSMLTFEQALLVADGSSTIQTWNGTTAGYSSITDSPSATALCEISNRVVANDKTEPDSVYLSAPNDALTTVGWNTLSSAIGIKAGFGDGFNVNGFAAFQNDLIVSKTGSHSGNLMRINVADSTPSNWTVTRLSKTNSSQSAETILQALNDIFFASNSGFCSLKGVQQYGDLQVDPTGRKINVLFNDASCTAMTYLPYFNAIWFILNTRMYCYHINGAFTSLTFPWTPASICEHEGDVYIGATNGYLYKINKTGYTDEITPGVYQTYTSEAKTKLFTGQGQVLLKSIDVRLKPKASGTARIYVYSIDQGEVIAKEITLIGSGDYLYDATGYLSNATGYLSEEGLDSWREYVRTKARASGVGLVFRTMSGGTSIENLKAQFASVE
jgi:hypothetical protein